MSQICYVFSDSGTAQAACAKCDAGLKIKWSMIDERNDGKFYFEKPDEKDINCQSCSEPVKCTYTEEVNDGDWNNGEV